MVEYQVVEQRAKGFLGGRMKPGDLQLLLNRHDDRGWTLDRIIDNEGHRSMFAGTGVFYVIFRRPVQTPSA